MITTHYMEEAAKAHKLGFMRNGKLLAEGTPEEIKTSAKADTINNAFLNLCCKDEEGQNKGAKSEKRTDNHLNEFEMKPLTMSVETTNTKAQNINRKTKLTDSILALIYKNLLFLRRGRVFLGFQALMPLISMVFTYFTLGRPLSDVKLAVVNEESTCENFNYSSYPCPSFNNFDFLVQNASCHVINELQKDNLFLIDKMYQDFDKGYESVKIGHAYGLIAFKKGFSESLVNRLKSTLFKSAISSEDLDISDVHISLDQTNLEVFHSIKVGIFKSIHNLILNYAESCQLENAVIRIKSLGLAILDMHGEKLSKNISMYILPGTLVVMLCNMPMALTINLFFEEKRTGVLSRDLACGIGIGAAMLTFMVSMLPVTLMQVTASFGFLLSRFPGTPLNVIFFDYFLMVVVSIAGMNVGLLISSVSKNIEQALQYGLAATFMGMVFAGGLWPKMTMPLVMQYFSMILPFGIPTDVARYIMINDTLQYHQLWLGLAVPAIDAILMFFASLFILKHGGLRMKS